MGELSARSVHIREVWLRALCAMTEAGEDSEWCFEVEWTTPRAAALLRTLLRTGVVQHMGLTLEFGRGDSLDDLSDEQFLAACGVALQWMLAMGVQRLRDVSTMIPLPVACALAEMATDGAVTAKNVAQRVGMKCTAPDWQAADVPLDRRTAPWVTRRGRGVGVEKVTWVYPEAVARAMEYLYKGKLVESALCAAVDTIRESGV